MARHSSSGSAATSPKLPGLKGLLSPHQLRIKARNHARKVLLGSEERGLREALLSELRKPPRVQLKDKVCFTLGVFNVVASVAIMAGAPHLFKHWYALWSVPLLAWRYYTYRQAKFSYFMLDFCYFVNALCYAHLFVAPNSPVLFSLTFMCANGPLAFAILAWRNSLVFHDLEKITSLFIHIMPPLLMFCQRWLVLGAAADGDPLPAYLVCPGGGGDGGLCSATYWHSMALPLLFYAGWQAVYFYKTEVADRAALAADPAIQTSLRWLARAGKGLMHDVAMRLAVLTGTMRRGQRFNPDELRTKLVFMAAQLLYTALTLLPTKAMFDHAAVHGAFLLLFAAIATWNGSSFYIDVFARRYHHDIEAAFAAGASVGLVDTAAAPPPPPPLAAAEAEGPAGAPPIVPPVASPTGNAVAAESPGSAAIAASAAAAPAEQDHQTPHPQPRPQSSSSGGGGAHRRSSAERLASMRLQLAAAAAGPPADADADAALRVTPSQPLPREKDAAASAATSAANALPLLSSGAGRQAAATAAPSPPVPSASPLSSSPATGGSVGGGVGGRAPSCQSDAFTFAVSEPSPGAGSIATTEGGELALSSGRSGCSDQQYPPPPPLDADSPAAPPQQAQQPRLPLNADSTTAAAAPSAAAADADIPAAATTTPTPAAATTGGRPRSHSLLERAAGLVGDIAAAALAAAAASPPSAGAAAAAAFDFGSLSDGLRLLPASPASSPEGAGADAAAAPADAASAPHRRKRRHSHSQPPAEPAPQPGAPPTSELRPSDAGVDGGRGGDAGPVGAAADPAAPAAAAAAAVAAGAPADAYYSSAAASGGGDGDGDGRFEVSSPALLCGFSPPGLGGALGGLSPAASSTAAPALAGHHHPKALRSLQGYSAGASALLARTGGGGRGRGRGGSGGGGRGGATPKPSFGGVVAAAGADIFLDEGALNRLAAQRAAEEEEAAAAEDSDDATAGAGSGMPHPLQAETEAPPRHTKMTYYR